MWHMDGHKWHVIYYMWHVTFAMSHVVGGEHSIKKIWKKGSLTHWRNEWINYKGVWRTPGLLTRQVAQSLKNPLWCNPPLCTVEYPYNTKCDDKTSTTHFLVPFGPIFQIFFLWFFLPFLSMSGNFLTIRNPHYGEIAKLQIKPK